MFITAEPYVQGWLVVDPCPMFVAVQEPYSRQVIDRRQTLPHQFIMFGTNVVPKVFLDYWICCIYKP